ncbi:MAG: ATP-binding protein [Magnetococcus sp. MYC-9]
MDNIYDFKGFVQFMRSLFNNRDVFRRELIQNALEACFQAEQRGHGADGRIGITLLPEEGCFRITDNGVGMTLAEMKTRLTIPFASGWRADGHNSLGIGQFGFGFHSVFLVADQVQVISRSRIGDEPPHKMVFSATDGVEFQPLDTPSLPFGTTVDLQIQESFRHLLDEELTRADIRTIFIHTRYPITLNGFNLGIWRPDGWRNPVYGGDARHVSEWLMARYAWDEPPIAIWPVPFENGGWIAVAAGPEPVPALEVYRRGIRIVQQELIPKPLNNMICGIIDTDSCAVKPDRETLIEDAAARQMIEAIRNAIVDMLTTLGQREPQTIAEIFKHYHSTMMESLKQDKRLVHAVGPHYPLKRLHDDEPRPLREIVGTTQRLLWIRNPAAERVFADRAYRMGRHPVLMQEQEQQVVLHICDVLGITHASVSAEFVDEMQGQARPSPLIDLFRRVVPSDWVVICTADVDARLPLTVARLTTRSKRNRLPTELAGMGGALGALFQKLLEEKVEEEARLVILNRNNRIMAALERHQAHTEEDQKLARLLFFVGRLACDSNVTTEDMDEFLSLLTDHLGNQAMDRSGWWAGFRDLLKK